MSILFYHFVHPWEVFANQLPSSESLLHHALLSHCTFIHPGTLALSSLYHLKYHFFKVHLG